MDKSAKFVLPSPNFDKTNKLAARPRSHFLTPSGMTLLPREKQPPPMYGARGTTVPGKFLNNEATNQKLRQNQNEPQYCEACEMELQSMEDMHRHRAQHEHCPVEGCSYRGHPSVMDKHVAALHATGLFDKCKKLSTPEEIAAWREERRKRFPTVANVQMRQKAQEQRQKRGERLEANKSRFGKKEDRTRMQRGERAEHKKELEPQKMPEERNRNAKNVQRNNRRKKAKNAGAAIKAEPQCEAKTEIQPKNLPPTEIECFGVRMFEGTKTLPDYKHFKIKKAVEVKNALTSLLGMYGSGNEDSDTEEDISTVMVQPDTKNVEPIETANTKTLCDEENTNKMDCLNVPAITKKSVVNTFVENGDTIASSSTKLFNDDDKSLKISELQTSNIATENQASSDEAPDEAPIAKSSNIPAPLPRQEPPRKQTKTDHEPQKLRARKRTLESGLDYRKARLRKQNTMLEKLLEPDIRHERNVLLQCVRFVCENNYFGVGQKNY